MVYTVLVTFWLDLVQIPVSERGTVGPLCFRNPYRLRIESNQNASLPGLPLWAGVRTEYTGPMPKPIASSPSTTTSACSKLWSRDLRRHYVADYRIVRLLLEQPPWISVATLVERSEAVALFLSGSAQRPG